MQSFPDTPSSWRQQSPPVLIGWYQIRWHGPNSIKALLVLIIIVWSFNTNVRIYEWRGRWYQRGYKVSKQEETSTSLLNVSGVDIMNSSALVPSGAPLWQGTLGFVAIAFVAGIIGFILGVRGRLFTKHETGWVVYRYCVLISKWFLPGRCRWFDEEWEEDHVCRRRKGTSFSCAVIFSRS